MPGHNLPEFSGSNHCPLIADDVPQALRESGLLQAEPDPVLEELVDRILPIYRVTTTHSLALPADPNVRLRTTAETIVLKDKLFGGFADPATTGISRLDQLPQDERPDPYEDEFDVRFQLVRPTILRLLRRKSHFVESEEVPGLYVMNVHSDPLFARPTDR